MLAELVLAGEPVVVREEIALIRLLGCNAAAAAAAHRTSKVVMMTLEAAIAVNRIALSVKGKELQQEEEEQQQLELHKGPGRWA